MGRRLKDDNIIVSLHVYVDGNSLVSRPSLVGTSGIDHIAILPSLDLPFMLLDEGTHKWTFQQHNFTLRGVKTTDAMIRVITKLVANGAITDRNMDAGKFLEVPRTEAGLEQEEILQWLAALGYAERQDEHAGFAKWRLSVEGSVCLEHSPLITRR